MNSVFVLRLLAVSALALTVLSACSIEPSRPWPQQPQPPRPSTPYPAPEHPQGRVPAPRQPAPAQQPKPGDLPEWASPAPPAPTAGGPVASLLSKAQTERSAGDLQRAEATLERAMRIAPYDALVLHRMASLKLELGEHVQAAALASKSNGLIRGDTPLKAENQRIIDAARP